MHVRLFPPARFALGVTPFARVVGLLLSLVTLHAVPILDLRTHESPGPSSRRTSLVFTEIHYHPIEEARDGDAGSAYEFVELYNSNPYFEDISGWKLDGAVEFVFPPGTRIEGLKRLVVAADPEKLKARHGITNVLGPWMKRLGNEGDTLRLVKGSGGVVLEVSYSDEAPWPVAADGAGHSLVLVRPSYGENHPWAWAASAAIGGSPGEPEPVPTGAFERVLIDEIFANSTSPALDFIEVRNHGPVLVDLSGCWLSDDPLTNKFRIPEGTQLEAGRGVSFDEKQLGFSLKAGGERVYLRQPDGGRVLDAVAYGAQAPGLSWGRPPDGEGALRELERPTPGDTNAPQLQRPVVINELFYHPPYGLEENEFVELHNRGGVAVDLGGWSFGRGVDYTFDAGTILPAGGYLVVARNRTQLLASHPGLDPRLVVGNYGGALSDSGERVSLRMPVMEVVEDPVNHRRTTNVVRVVVNEVAYKDGGSWGKWADGGGSSLELIDVRADNALASNWADSDESGKSTWERFERTAALTYQHSGVPSGDTLQVLLLDAGEAHLDDVEFIQNGVNKVRNGTFATGRTEWVGQGTHRLTAAATDAGNGVLRVVAVERGDHVANRIRTRLSSAVPISGSATLRARARWLRGHPEMLFRLRGGGIEMVATLPIPRNLGTPGARNSRSIENAPPSITSVQHWPILPKANEAVRITARVQDVDGVGGVEVVRRLDATGAIQSFPMVDDGTGGDERAGDGLYTALLPGQAAAVLMGFHVRATDARVGLAATGVFPGDAPSRECLVRFGDTLPANVFGTYRLWLTRSVISSWSAREKMSNEDLNGTFVYGTNRVIYAMGAHFSGSSYTSPGYDSPVGSLCGYDFNYPADEPFLGETHTTLDWPLRDDTVQREQLMFWFLEQYGLPNMHRRYVNLYVNGTKRGTLYEDIQQPSSETVREYFPQDDDGTLWKTDCWNEFDDAGNRIDPCILNTLERFPATGAKNAGRYRWNWRPRAVRGSANDFTDLFTLVDAANASLNYQSVVEGVVDMENWTRTFAMNDLASFWDAFGNGNGKNTFLYKPRFDGWKLYSWDFDVGLGVFNDPPTAQLFDANDPLVTKMMRTPPWLRMYWEALQEAMDGFFQVTRFGPMLDAKQAAFRANNIVVTAPSAIKTWVNQRRTYLQTQLNTVRAPLAFTINGGQDFTAKQSAITLAGTAPVTARTLRINGAERRVNWTTVSNWTAGVILQPGVNRFVIEGYNRFGTVLTNAPDVIQITFQGDPAAPAQVRINEWMASNQHTIADPVDGAFDDWFELYNAGTTTVNLSGFTLTDTTNAPTRYVIPAGFDIAPKGFLMVWADQQPEQTKIGGELHVNFKLSSGGETIALYDNTGRLLDQVTFGNQLADVSEGRYPEGGSDPFWNFPVPSPRTTNAGPQLPPGQLRFTRIIANADDQVELTWRTAPGRRYRVRSAVQMGSSWEWTVGAEQVAAGETLRAVDPSPPAEGVRLYQIMEVP